jgi:small basic protein (TIGR04137 family)
MSLDKSLKSTGALARHRNVLTRAERIEKLREEGRWDDESGPIGLPKVAHRKSTAGAKEKKAAKAAEAPEEEKPAETES